MMTFGSSLTDDHISFSICRASFLHWKNSVLTPGVCPPSSFVDPQGEGMVEEQLFSTQFSPGPVLTAEGGLWAAPLCHCFCRSSVILTTPLSFRLSSAPCCSCISSRIAHLPSTTMGSCLGRIPLAARA